MASILKIKIEDLTPQLIEQVKLDYPNQKVEIRIGEAAQPDLLQEDQFWEIISLLDWSQEENNQIIDPAVKKLAEQPVHFIYLFQDLLSEKLYHLDQQKFAIHIGEDAWTEGTYFSVDNFLYARCAVVANGKAVYKEVIDSPTEMPKEVTFEPILSIARKAYYLKTGKKFDYFPAHNYETYSNKKGWNI